MKEPKIPKPRIPWKHKDHLATPSNIAKYEFACCKDCIYRKQALNIVPKALRHGSVKWIMKDGKVIN
jgi:hypothetical protein